MVLLMTSPLETARAYHRAWTDHDFEHAAALLAPQLLVEVPINDYPTKASFAEALQGFGSLVVGVEMLAEFGDDREAIQLYDMQVQGLGTMRIVEHFTVADGQIVRLRQIHDTAPLAGLAS